MERVPKISELTYKCRQCGFTNIKKKSISACSTSWGVSRGITQKGSYPLATPTPDTFDLEILVDGLPNHILNPDMEVWSSGVSSPPDSWLLGGVGATVARESTIIHSGSYGVKLTAAAALAYIYNVFSATLGAAYWRGKTVIGGCWIWSSVPIVAPIQIYDTTAFSISKNHTGHGWEWLTCIRTLDVATNTAYLLIYTPVGVTAYFDQAILIEGSSIQHNNISFTAATSSTPARINDASSRFADLGFVPGDTIIISTTSGTNDGTYTLAERGAITQGSLTLSEDDSLTTESANAAGTVTISVRKYKPNITTGCPFCGSLNSQ